MPNLLNTNGSGKKILVIDGMVPRPDRDSGSLRMHNLLRLLADLGYQVTFAAANLETPQPYTGQLQAAGIEVLARPNLLSLQDYLQQAGPCFDTIILSRVSVATRYMECVRYYAPQARVVFDTVDLHYVREFRGAKVTGNMGLLKRALQTKAQELAAVNAADCTLVVSATEKETLAQECPGAAVQIVSNIHQIFKPVPAFASRKDILEIAGAAKAEIFVLAIDNPETSIKTAKMVKEYFPQLKIIARARNRQHAIELMELEVPVIHRETFMTSLEVAKEVLVMRGGEKNSINQRLAKFKASDENILKKQFKLRHDEKEFILYTKKANEELDEILRADRKTNTNEDVDGTIG